MLNHEYLGNVNAQISGAWNWGWLHNLFAKLNRGICTVDWTSLLCWFHVFCHNCIMSDPLNKKVFEAGHFRSPQLQTKLLFWSKWNSSHSHKKKNAFCLQKNLSVSSLQLKTFEQDFNKGKQRQTKTQSHKKNLFVQQCLMKCLNTGVQWIWCLIHALFKLHLIRKETVTRQETQQHSYYWYVQLLHGTDSQIQIHFSSYH